ncbi:MAG TPA: TerC family protein [Edaphocola sp.]|nr:TerC family protein [Edaphocola sp.]
MSLAESIAHLNPADPHLWVSLLTLTFLEIVLGIDNIIFISIITGKVALSQQRGVRNAGLGIAMLFRIVLLLMITWIIGLKDPVLTLNWIDDPLTNEAIALSWKDIILLCGGIFLVGKSTVEIHHKMRADETEHSENKKPNKTKGVASILIQIVLIDAIFSIDSILTAVGLVENVMIMIIAVIISMFIMMLFSGAVSRIINNHPTLQMLALSFLVVIGVVLIAEGIHQHVSKSIIYSCLAFSLGVEMLNIKLRNRMNKKKRV